MAPGLKHHNHQERSRVIQELIPLVKRHMGAELLALAVTGSFARGTDGRYSDIELIGIVSRPQGERAAVKFIHDGMVVDIWFLTKDHYLDHHRSKVRTYWPYAALSTLVPLVNDALIEEINRAELNTRLEDRMAALKALWPDFQEGSAKILTAAHRNDVNALPYLFWQTAEKMCAILSLVNGRPFTNSAAAFTEVHQLQTLPENFHTLFTPKAADAGTAEIARTTMALFEGLERILLQTGIDLYAPSLDAFVAEEPRASPFRRAAHKVRDKGRTLREFLRLNFQS